MHSIPTLCLVLAYSLPVFPKPTNYRIYNRIIYDVSVFTHFSNIIIKLPQIIINLDKMEGEYWGKPEITKVLDEFAAKGDRRTKQEILKVIKEQEPELASIEMNMIKMTMTVFGILISFLARR